MVAWLTLFTRGNDNAVVTQNRRPLVVKKNDAIAVDYEHVLSTARKWWGNNSDFDLAVGISKEEMWPVANSQDLVDMLGAAEEVLEEQGGGGQISVFAKEKPRGLANTTVTMKCSAADARAGGRAIVASLMDDADSIDDDDEDAGAARAAGLAPGGAGDAAAAAESAPGNGAAGKKKKSRAAKKRGGQGGHAREYQKQTG